MSASSEEDAVTASTEKEHLVVGLIADPGATPEQVAQQLQGDLAEQLAEQLDGETSWDVQVSYETLPTGTYGHASMFDVGHERMRRYGWDLVVCISDLPMTSGKHPIVAEASQDRRAAVVSLPAFGIMRLQRRCVGWSFSSSPSSSDKAPPRTTSNPAARAANLAATG